MINFCFPCFAWKRDEMLVKIAIASHEVSAYLVCLGLTHFLILSQKNIIVRPNNTKTCCNFASLERATIVYGRNTTVYRNYRIRLQQTMSCCSILFAGVFIFLTWMPRVSREVTRAVQCFRINNDPTEVFNWFLIPFPLIFRFLLFSLSRPDAIAMLSPGASFNLASKQKILLLILSSD